MTWIAEPAADALCAVSRYEALQEWAAENERVLVEASERLDEAALLIAQERNPRAPDEDPTGDVGTIQLAMEIRRLRARLIELTGLRKPVLPREILQQLRDDFDFVKLEDSEARRALAEKVAGRPLDRLSELTEDEARALRAEIQKLEEAF